MDRQDSDRCGEKNKGKCSNLDSNSGPIHRASLRPMQTRVDGTSPPSQAGATLIIRCQSARPRPANVFEGVDRDVRGSSFLNCCFHLSAGNAVLILELPFIFSGQTRRVNEKEQSTRLIS